MNFYSNMKYIGLKNMTKYAFLKYQKVSFLQIPWNIVFKPDIKNYKMFFILRPIYVWHDLVLCNI